MECVRLRWEAQHRLVACAVPEPSFVLDVIVLCTEARERCDAAQGRVVMGKRCRQGEGGGLRQTARVGGEMASVQVRRDRNVASTLGARLYTSGRLAASVSCE